MAALAKNTVMATLLPFNPILFIKPIPIIPVGATGLKAPAFAPVQIIIAIKSALMEELAATAMPIGAIKAVAAIFPGPMAERIKVNTKNKIGKSFGLPFTRLIKYLLNLAKVPFSSAILNNKQMDINIKNKSAGNPAAIVFIGKFAPYTPMAKARAIAIIPVFIFGLIQPTMIAKTNASKDINAIGTAISYSSYTH